MISLDEDPIIGRFFDTPDKKAKWIFRIKILYLLWIFFMIFGIIFILIWHLVH